MGKIALAMIFSICFEAQAKVHNFNEEIRQASVTQRILHRRLLRILQGLEVSIAEDTLAKKQIESQSPSPNFQIRLVRTSN